MSDYLNIRPPSGKKGPATYKPAKGSVGRGSYSNVGKGKPATKKKVNIVDKRVKKVSNKVMGLKGKKTPGPAATNVGGGNPA